MNASRSGRCGAPRGESDLGDAHAGDHPAEVAGRQLGVQEDVEPLVDRDLTDELRFDTGQERPVPSQAVRGGDPGPGTVGAHQDAPAPRTRVGLAGPEVGAGLDGPVREPPQDRRGVGRQEGVAGPFQVERTQRRSVDADAGDPPHGVVGEVLAVGDLLRRGFRWCGPRPRGPVCAPTPPSPDRARRRSGRRPAPRSLRRRSPRPSGDPGTGGARRDRGVTGSPRDRTTAATNDRCTMRPTASMRGEMIVHVLSRHPSASRDGRAPTTSRRRRRYVRVPARRAPPRGGTAVAPRAARHTDGGAHVDARARAVARLPRPTPGTRSSRREPLGEPVVWEKCVLTYRLLVDGAPSYAAADVEEALRRLAAATGFRFEHVSDAADSTRATRS